MNGFTMTFELGKQTVTLRFSTQKINAELKKTGKLKNVDPEFRSLVFLSLPMEYLMRIARFEVMKAGVVKKDFTVRQLNALRKKLLVYLEKVEQEQVNKL